MRRNELIAYRVNEQEKKELGMLAQFYGVNKSELIRLLVEREARDQAEVVQIASKSEDPVKLARLMRIGG